MCIQCEHSRISSLRPSAHLLSLLSSHLIFSPARLQALCPIGGAKTPKPWNVELGLRPGGYYSY